jgi:hypothetical protein
MDSGLCNVELGRVIGLQILDWIDLERPDARPKKDAVPFL